MYAAGRWTSASETLQVLNPFDNSVVESVPSATADDVEQSIASLKRGAEIMRTMPAHQRATILQAAAQLVRERVSDFADTISREEGKILAEATMEAQRGAEILAVSAEEAKRLTGEMVPLDGVAGGGNKSRFTPRVPRRLPAANTPSNFPLHPAGPKAVPAISPGKGRNL